LQHDVGLANRIGGFPITIRVGRKADNAIPTVEGGLVLSDVRTDSSYSSGTQTHSQENEARPWWELDLGNEQAIESLMIWNRVDGGLGSRLEGYTLTILDTERREVFKKHGMLFGHFDHC
jgi:hypothetical protein